MRKRNYTFMTVEEVQKFVKTNGLRAVRDYPELKTKQRAVFISQTGDTLEVVARDGGFDVEYRKFDPTDEKGYTQAGLKQIYFFGKVYYLQWLVAHTWLDKSYDPDRTRVHIKNGKRNDIRPENLQWISCREVTMKAAETRKRRRFLGYWRNGRYTDPNHQTRDMSREEYLDMMEKKRGKAYRRKLENDRLRQQEIKESRIRLWHDIVQRTKLN